MNEYKVVAASKKQSLKDTYKSGSDQDTIIASFSVDFLFCFVAACMFSHRINFCSCHPWQVSGFLGSCSPRRKFGPSCNWFMEQFPVATGPSWSWSQLELVPVTTGPSWSWYQLQQQ